MTVTASRPVAPATAAWQNEARAVLALAWPLALGNLAQIAITTTDVIMLGWLGPEPLAAGALAANLLFPLHYFCLGLVSAVAPIMAQALGARAFKQVRRAARQGFWAAVAITLPAALILWNGERLMLLIGQDPALAGPAQAYLDIALWGFLPSLGFVVLRCLLAVHNRPRAALLIVLGGGVLNAASNYLLIFGHFGFPRLELEGAAITSVVVNFAMFLGLLLFVVRDRRLRRYHILARLWRPDWPLFAEIFRLGLPMGLTLLAEVGMFAVSMFFMGLIGTFEVAAHAVASQMAGIVFMLPLGLAQAATIRVGLAVGAGDSARMRRAGWSALGLGLLCAVGTAALLWFGDQLIGQLFLGLGGSGHPEVLALVIRFLHFAALFQLFDATQGVVAGALRGLKDTRMPMLMATAGYWGIGTGSAALLAFSFEMGGDGIWTGLTLGLMSVALLLTLRFRRLASTGRSWPPGGRESAASSHVARHAIRMREGQIATTDRNHEAC